MIKVLKICSYFLGQHNFLQSQKRDIKGNLGITSRVATQRHILVLTNNLDQNSDIKKSGKKSQNNNHGGRLKELQRYLNLTSSVGPLPRIFGGTTTSR